MKLKNKTIGIWGYGRVGSSVARFCTHRGAKIIIWDDNSIECSHPKAPSLDLFLAQADIIIPSPGIDITPYYQKYKKKWLTELDLFSYYFTKKIIAVTGTLGKTSVTTLLAKSLELAGWRVIAAGNIGTPCLDSIDQHKNLDAIVLEVSSFQLEHCRSFAPDVAIWTNFYPNHLDRHKTMDAYLNAKLTLLKYQRTDQHAIIPASLKKHMRKAKASICYFDQTGIAQNNAIIRRALDMLSPKKIPIAPMPALEHRLEHVATKNNIQFINDSKSTTPQSTLAAIESISAHRILLFLGGLSKGIDRSDLVAALQSKSIIVFCFGKEADLLHALCNKYHLQAYKHANLDSAFDASTKIMQPGDCILFSPSGSSFDLFTNYEKRGTAFKSLVYSL